MAQSYINENGAVWLSRYLREHEPTIIRNFKQKKGTHGVCLYSTIQNYDDKPSPLSCPKYCLFGFFQESIGKYRKQFNVSKVVGLTFRRTLTKKIAKQGYRYETQGNYTK